MTDPTEHAVPAPVEPVSPAKPAFARRNWGKLTLLALVGSPALVFALWTTIALNWSYSSGVRAGYVQKISKKGFLCKTWEGALYTDIAKGFRSDSFAFSVRSDSLAHVIETLSGKRVSVNYDQHINVPTSCFGETEYFVKGITVIPE